MLLLDLMALMSDGNQQQNFKLGLGLLCHRSFLGRNALILLSLGPAPPLAITYY